MKKLLLLAGTAFLIMSCGKMNSEDRKMEKDFKAGMEKAGDEGRKITQEMYDKMDNLQRMRNGGKILSSSPEWKTTVVKDEQGNDVTANNQMYVGLATYKSDRYEFFNLDGTPRNDQGYFFITRDMKRVLVSETQNYTRIVDVTELSPKMFTYKVTNPQGMTVWVSHEPVKEMKK